MDRNTTMTIVPAKLQNVRYDIRGPLQQKADEMRGRGEEILRLNIGNPAPFGFTAPDWLIERYVEKLVAAQGYSDTKGLEEARNAVAEYYQKKGVDNASPDNVYTGNGVSELILLSMQALLESGDEILVPSPDYPLWTAAVRLAGGVPCHYVCDENAFWYPDLSDIRKKITPRTRGLVLINPNNPTGALYPREILEELAEVARQHNLILFADEIYDRLVLDEEPHTAMASVAPDLLTVSFNGLSKSHLISGFRCGWMCLSGDLSAAPGFVQALELLASMRLCSNVPAQAIIPDALKAQTCTQELLPQIRERREAVCKALEKIPGISACRPQAGFYIFPKIDLRQYPITDDNEFALWLLQEEKILITPGSGFNWAAPDHFRIVFLPQPETLRCAVEQIGSLLARKRQSTHLDNVSKRDYTI